MTSRHFNQVHVFTYRSVRCSSEEMDRDLSNKLNWPKRGRRQARMRYRTQASAVKNGRINMTALTALWLSESSQLMPAYSGQSQAEGQFVDFQFNPNLTACGGTGRDVGEERALAPNLL